MTSWTVERSQDIKRYEAEFPGHLKSKPPDYIRLSYRGHHEFLWTSTEPNAGELQVILVSEEAFPDVEELDNTEPVQYKKIGKARFQWNRVLHDPESRTWLLGFILTAVGLIFTKAVAIGEYYPLLQLPTVTFILLMVLGACIEIAGMFIVFVMVPLEGKERS